MFFTEVRQYRLGAMTDVGLGLVFHFRIPKHKNHMHPPPLSKLPCFVTCNLSLCNDVSALSPYWLPEPGAAIAVPRQDSTRS